MLHTLIHTTSTVTLTLLSPAVLEDFEDVVSEGVSVLAQQTVRVVKHFPCVVADAKLGVVHFGLDVVRVVLWTQALAYHMYTIP